MNPRQLLISLATAVLGASTSVAVAAPNAAPSANPASTAASTSAAPTLAGAWKLDRSKSTFPRRPEGGMRGGGMREGGRPEGGHEMGSGGGPGRDKWGGGSGGMRGDGSRRGAGGFMSSLLRITQANGVVTLSDSSGAPFQEIAYLDSAPPKSSLRRLGGEWNGKNLIALGETPMGGTVTENYTLKDDGRTLEIRTRVIPEGDRPPMEFVRVYQRMTEPK